MCAHSLPFTARGERKLLSWKKFWYISISSHPKLWQEIRRCQPSWYYQNLCMDRSYKTLNIHMHKAAKGRDLQTGGDKVLPGETAAPFLNSLVWVSLRGGPAMSHGEAQLDTFALVAEGQVPHGQAACAGKLPWNPACATRIPKVTRVRSSWKFQIGDGIVFLAAFFTKTKSKDGICD